MNNFSPISGGVARTMAPGEIKPLRIPERVDESVFRAVLAAYTTAYRLVGRHPSVEEVWRQWPRITESAVGEMLVLPEFREALAARGIEADDLGLSHLQHMAVLAFADPLDKRSTKQKLDALGITTQQFAIWKRQTVFQAALDGQSRRLAHDYAPEIRARMVQQAEGGSFQHQSFLLEQLGEGPKAREQQTSQQLVMAFVSAITRATNGHPEIREAIMLEMRGSMLALQAAAE